MTYDKKLNRHKRQKQHKPDNIIATDHELPKSLNDGAGGRGPLIPMQENSSCAREVEGQSRQCKKQNEARKYRELNRPEYLNGRQQHEHRGRNAARQQ